MAIVTSISFTILSVAQSVFFFIFFALKIDLFFKAFCPDVYWSCVRPVRARSDYNELKKAVLSSKAVLEAVGYEVKSAGSRQDVQSMSQGVYRRMRNQMKMKKAEEIFASMAATPRVVLLRLMAYFLRKVWRWLYPLGIHISEEEIRPVLDAAQRGPLLLLPTHKSHVDALFVTYMCFEYGLPIPYVVVGDNLDLPIIGSLFRSAGGFFYPTCVDDLSSAVFGEYVKALLDRGHSVECFIEGGRSRSGKVQQPKVMMLQRIIDWVLDDNGDAMIVPISLTYERIVENDSHLDELSGEDKKAEKIVHSLQNISSAIASSLMSVTCFGRVDLSFAEPFSIQENVHRRLNQMKASSEYSSIMTERKIRVHLTLSIGYQTLFLCNKVSVAEPAALISTILLTQSTRGISRQQLKKEVMWLYDLIRTHGGRVAYLRPEYIDIVLTLILEPIVGQNQLIKKHKNLLMVDLYSPKERMELSLYENQIIHHFVQVGLVSLAFYKREKTSSQSATTQEETTRFCVDIDHLNKDIKFLSSLLKYEFIYPPSRSLETSFEIQLIFWLGWVCSNGWEKVNNV